MRSGFALVVVAALAAPTYASPAAFGVRVGVTDDLDSVFIGGQADFDDIGGIQNLRLEPSLDLGYGRQETPLFEIDYFTLRLSGNAKYLVPIGSDGDMSFYPVGGLSIYYVNINDCDRNCDDTDIGINLGVGFEFQQFAIDVWLGFDDDEDDLPDITLVGAYTFP
jgi:hypothetical protein